MQKIKQLPLLNNLFLILYFIYFFVAYLTSVEFIKSTSRYSYTPYLKEGLIGICILGILFCFMSIMNLKFRASVFMIYFVTVILINVNFVLLQLHYSYLCVCLMHMIFFNQSEINNSQWISIFNNKIHSKYVLGIFLNLTITISGLSKCFHQGWFTGQTLKFIVSNNYAINSRLELSSMSTEILTFLSMCILASEIVALPLFLFRKTRVAGLCINVLLQLGIFVFMPDIRNISVAMIIVFFYIYDRTLYSSSFTTEKAND